MKSQLDGAEKLLKRMNEANALELSKNKLKLEEAWKNLRAKAAERKKLLDESIRLFQWCTQEKISGGSRLRPA